MPPSLENLRTTRFVLAGALLSVTNFLAVFDGLVVTVALPAMQQQLDLEPLQAQWVITAYALPLGGMLLLGGRSGDRFGRRRVLVTGLYTFVVGLLLAGLAPTAWALFTGRVIQGVGAALAIPNAFAMISSMRRPRRRNKLFAAVAIAGSCGAAGGAVIGGLVTQSLGWRYIFLLTVPVAAGAALAAPRVLSPQQPAVAGGRLDAVAALLSAGGLMLLVLAITGVESAGIASVRTLTALALASLVLGAFVLHERRTRDPLMHARLLRVRSLTASIASMPGQVFAYQGAVYLGLLFFQQALFFSPLQAGVSFAPLGLAALGASPLAARLLSMTHWTTVVLLAQVACAGGLVLLATAHAHTSYWLRLLPALVLIGAGITVVAVALNMAAGKDVAAEDKGVAYGLFETSTHVSGAIVVALLATVAAAGMRDAGGSAEAAAAAGYRLALFVAAGAAVGGGVLAVLLGRRSRDSARTSAGTAVSAPPTETEGVTSAQRGIT